jgi:hypothetical protein
MRLLNKEGIRKQKWISSCYGQIIFHAVSAVMKARTIWKYLKSTIKQTFRHKIGNGKTVLLFA